MLLAVCVKLMTRFIESLDESIKSNPTKIENEFRKFCKSTKADDNRFVSSFSCVKYGMKYQVRCFGLGILASRRAILIFILNNCKHDSLICF